MPWLVRGDIDGFFGLAIDNLVQLLVIVALCRGVLGFSDALIMGTILPGVAVSLVVGNVFYAWQAKELARRTGRTDICALPYGVNTVSLFAFIFLVMLPALLAAKARGLGDQEATLAAWRMGLVACFGAGLIEVLAAPFADYLRRATPRAALLSTLGGIALGFISFSFLFRTYANPVVGLATLGVILMVYFGKVRFQGRLAGRLRRRHAGHRAVVRDGPRPAQPAVFADARPQLSRAGAGRHPRRAQLARYHDLPLRDRADGHLQRVGLAAKHRVPPLPPAIHTRQRHLWL